MVFLMKYRYHICLSRGGGNFTSFLWTLITLRNIHNYENWNSIRKMDRLWDSLTPNLYNFIWNSQTGDMQSPGHTRACAKHFENGFLQPYEMHCKHNYQRYHINIIASIRKKHTYMAGGTALSPVLHTIIITITVYPNEPMSRFLHNK